VHIANLVMSMLSSGQFSIKLDANSVSGRGLGSLALLGARDVDAQGKYRPNPCSFYLLNLAIDVSLLSSSLHFMIGALVWVRVWRRDGLI
jgi:hypothetical protein